MEKFELDSEISFSQMYYPKKIEEVRNNLLYLWNLSEESYNRKIKVYILIVETLRQWYNEKLVKSLCDYFWEDLVIKALERGLQEWEISEKMLERIKNVLRE